MDFRFSKEEEEFRQEIREFLKSEAELIEKVRLETDLGAGQGPASKELIRKLGDKSYLTPSWPKKYGGLDKSYIERYIAAEELSYYVGNLTIVGASMVGPTILLFGTDEQKETFLPKIARGESIFALGYTEPQAGSDLASLELRAVRDGDYYVLNGQKVFNTGVHFADYHWVAARTDPTVAKHRGLSLFTVDMNSPGITIRPMMGLGKFRTNEVFYDDVKVPKERLVGKENKGWRCLVTALSFERTWLVGDSQRVFEELLDYAKENRGESNPIDPVVRQAIAQLAIELELTRLLGIRIACMLNKGAVSDYEAATAKIFGSETSYRLHSEWMKLLSLYGQLDIYSRRAPLDGRVSRWFYHATLDLLTRGTSEIMKNIIAQRKLDLPRG